MLLSDFISARNCVPDQMGPELLHRNHLRVVARFVALIRHKVEDHFERSVDHDLTVDSSHVCARSEPTTVRVVALDVRVRSETLPSLSGLEAPPRYRLRGEAYEASFLVAPKDPILPGMPSPPRSSARTGVGKGGAGLS